MTDELLPQPLLLPSIKRLIFVLVCAHLLGFVEQTIENTVVTAFVDYGAILGSGLALFLVLVALQRTRSPLSGTAKRPRRLVIIGALSVLAVGRLLYGVGLTAGAHPLQFLPTLTFQDSLILTTTDTSSSRTRHTAITIR